MFWFMNCTWPSMNRTLIPPLWGPNSSSLGPQLLVDHGQVLGPPNGVGLLFTNGPATFVNSGLFGSPVGGPETPLAWSGSAQRLRARKLLGLQSTPNPAEQAGSA